MQLFIDANIYLEYFRENSAERLAPLEKLEKLVSSKKIELLIPEQTKQEYFRNRRKIAEVTRSALVKQGKISFLIPAMIDKEVSEMKTVLDRIEELGKAYKDLIKKYDHDVEKEKTDADNLIKKLFDKGRILKESKVIINRAYTRYMKGNPPRKSDHSYGDAIIWETLLEMATKDDLILVTKDGDYMETHKGDQIINNFLYIEWRIKSKKKKRVSLFKSLAELVNHLDKKQTIKKETVDYEKEKKLIPDLLEITPQYPIDINPTYPISLSENIGIADYRINNNFFDGSYLTSVPLSDNFANNIILYCPYCGNKAELYNNYNLSSLSSTYRCTGCFRTFSV